MIEVTAKNTRIWSRLGPSGALGIAALELAETGPDMVMLTADLSFFSGLERFKERYPDRLYNFGIAEQNMVGAAGGLAKEGFLPFVSTYASFATSRCADQVRVNMSYMKLPIKLIGLTSGFGAGILGATHMSIEDIAVMRSLPNITVISPADGTEIIKCMLAAAGSEEPTYIRLTGAMNTPVVYKEDYDFEIGKSIELISGNEVCMVATGSMVYESLEAAKLLNEKGISCSVINMHTIKPLDLEMLVKVIHSHKLIVTVEEHSEVGGLGGAVAEYMVAHHFDVRLEIIGIKDFFPHAGDYRYQLEQSGLTAFQICERIEKLL
jgi:transketolase